MRLDSEIFRSSNLSNGKFYIYIDVYSLQLDVYWKPSKSQNNFILWLIRLKFVLV